MSYYSKIVLIENIKDEELEFIRKILYDRYLYKNKVEGDKNIHIEIKCKKNNEDKNNEKGIIYNYENEIDLFDLCLFINKYL